MSANGVDGETALDSAVSSGMSDNAARIIGLVRGVKVDASRNDQQHCLGNHSRQPLSAVWTRRDTSLEHCCLARLATKSEISSNVRADHERHRNSPCCVLDPTVRRAEMATPVVAVPQGRGPCPLSSHRDHVTHLTAPVTLWRQTESPQIVITLAQTVTRCAECLLRVAASTL